MRQTDILAVLADGPMTTTQILDRMGLPYTKRAMLHNRMRSLLTKGAVRRAGYTGDRHPETVWEVVRVADRRHLIRRPEHRAVYDVIRDHPGITAREVCEYLPTIPRGQVVGAICALNGDLIRSCDTIRRRGGDVNLWEAMP